MSAFGGEADIAIFTTCETRKMRQQADPAPRAGGMTTPSLGPLPTPGAFPVQVWPATICVWA